MKNELKQQLMTRFKLNSLDKASLPVLASLLDPRFKNAKFLPQAEGKEEVKACLLSLMKAKTTKQSAPSPRPEQDQPEDEPPAKKSKSCQDWDLIGIQFDDSSQSQAGANLVERAEDELRRYMDSEPLSRKKNPLKWWKLKADSYPRIAKVAKRVLCVPASSASSERNFSSGGLVASQQRAALSPANVDAIIFLQKNMEHLFNMQLPPAVGDIKAEPLEYESGSVEGLEAGTPDGGLPCCQILLILGRTCEVVIKLSRHFYALS